MFKLSRLVCDWDASRPSCIEREEPAASSVAFAAIRATLSSTSWSTVPSEWTREGAAPNPWGLGLRGPPISWTLFAVREKKIYPKIPRQEGGSRQQPNTSAKGLRGWWRIFSLLRRRSSDPGRPRRDVWRVSIRYLV